MISGVTSSSVAQDSATISWTTDEPSNSQVEYGTSVAYGSSTPINPTLTTAHSASLSGLTSSTDYHPIDWLGIGNLVVWYSFWPVSAVIVWKFLRRKAGEVDVLAGSLIAATYLPLFYISLVTHRVEYAFYFINTDVGVALGIPAAITFLAGENKRLEGSLILLWLAAAVVFFLYYFPVNPFAFR